MSSQDIIIVYKAIVIFSDCLKNSIAYPLLRKLYKTFRIS